jgi:hypothetical protein
MLAGTQCAPRRVTASEARGVTRALLARARYFAPGFAAQTLHQP